MFSLQLKWMGYNVTNRRLAERGRGEGSHMRSAAGGITAIMRVQVGGWTMGDLVGGVDGRLAKWCIHGGCWQKEHYSTTSGVQ